MARFLFSFSGRLEKTPYLLFTVAFSLLVVAAIASDPANQGQLFSRLLGAPWTQLGAALDRLLVLETRLVDLLVSLALVVPVLWVWLALTVRRLRTLGQSPWWVLLIGSAVVPVMLALSFAGRSGDGRAPVSRP